jgi:hypothetical protein
VFGDDRRAVVKNPSLHAGRVFFGATGRSAQQKQN